MRRQVRSTVVGLVGVGLLAFAPGDATSQEGVQATEAAWAQALMAADMDALDALYADDLVYVHSNGSLDTKQGWLGAIETGRVAFSHMIPLESTVRQYGRTAVVNVLYDVILNDRSLEIQYLTVYVADHDSWSIVTQQTAILPTPEE